MNVNGFCKESLSVERLKRASPDTNNDLFILFFSYRLNTVQIVNNNQLITYYSITQFIMMLKKSINVMRTIKLIKFNEML